MRTNRSMKIAFTHNLRKSPSVEEAEFDNPETVDAIASAIASAGHQVARIDASGSPERLIQALRESRPDLIFNTAEGHRGRAREALAPLLFEELGIPFTGSDAHTLTITLDKWLTKLIVSTRGIPCVRGELILPDDLTRIREIGVGIPFPLFVKPNHEGSSKGIDVHSVARDRSELLSALSRLLEQYPEGVLAEEFIAGRDVSVGFIQGLGDGSVLRPVEYVQSQEGNNVHNIYDYALKNTSLSDHVHLRCPALVPGECGAKLKQYTAVINQMLQVRDISRSDFRISEDGQIFFLEINALPSLEPGSGLFMASAYLGLSYEQTIEAIILSAKRRYPSTRSLP